MHLEANSVWQTIGHEWATELLQRAVSSAHVAHAYLFTGPSHTGKTHLARRFAAALNCTGDMPPCGSCEACIRTGQSTHPDVMLIEPEGNKIKIDQMRALQHDLALSPYKGRWRVCIITDFQTTTVEAANALLKTLEEPPARVVLILTATDASLLLPTIVSRCQVLPLRAVPIQQIERALVDRWHAREDVARLLARLSAGHVGWAIHAAETPAVLTDRRQQIEKLLALTGQGRAGKIKAAEQLGKRDDLSEQLRLWQTWWRDVMLAASGCEDLVVSLDHLEVLRAQARQYDLVRAEAAVRGIEAALQQIEQNVNPRLVLEVLFLGWQPANPS
jgi:DNA polymerase III subunit delta'